MKNLKPDAYGLDLAEDDHEMRNALRFAMIEL